ncbi:hypothetical protein SELMODRAFT_415962 [Selaginella moellendorffii]|uniref:indole-3-glycerol-phosphate synthase n=1 Tax=Selaginella moellendorffii TaxID=88036 RepID=D8RXN1_SELML|nr:hypothetical protein SELMODRAFT_415962 [Selaginella moellendorffii]
MASVQDCGSAACDAWSAFEQKQRDLARQRISIRRLAPSGYVLKDGDEKPRNILEEIIWYKETEMKKKLPLYEMKQKLPPIDGPARDFVKVLKDRAAETGLPALIAEVKKASPSRGVIQPDFDPGSFENLSLIRAAQCPLLCKEFIIDPWQIYYARAKGADAVLLIASVLTDDELRSLMRVVKQNGMSALVEVHNGTEMDRVLELPGIELIGINNRNLETFKVDINNTVKLLTTARMDIIHALGIMVVGESGLFTPEDIAVVQKAGVRALGSLVFMEEISPKQNQRLLDRGPTPHWRIFRVFAESTEAAVDSDASVAAADDSQVEPETAKEEESGGAAQEEQTEAEKLVMMLKAEGSMPDVSIPIVQSSLEAMEDVSDVRITTFEGLTSISATNVASEIVDTMEKAGFRMHTLNLAIDDED